MSLFAELKERGLIYQATEGDLAERLEKERLTLYCGFDPTADSLHIGSLLPIMGLVRFQRAGHRPLVVLGGGTGLIGDPSGKASERVLLSREDVERNAAGIRKQLERFLDFSGEKGARLLNNIEWLGNLSLLDFLRDIGKHFSVNVLLTRESIRARLEDREHGISYTEFSYNLLQAYDFLYLYQHYECRLQVGGSDQWGNIVAGIDLIRRLADGVAYGLTFPLVTRADGAKFGKTEQGNVWLDPKRTSPYRFYQFWLNQSDADTPQYLRYFTLLPMSEITALEECLRREPEKREAQRRLAEEVTRWVHGEEALREAEQASLALFGGNLRGLDEQTLRDVFQEVPSARLPVERLETGALLVDVLVEAGVFPSKGEVRRMIRNGGLYWNDMRVDREDIRLNYDWLLAGPIAVVRKGKKNYFLLEFCSA
jgi:tyrosyl-tRNA synthetase